MKMVHPELNMQFLFDKSTYCEWIIESQECYLKYLQELMLQANGKEGNFLLSHLEKELDINKKVEVIIDPIFVDLNDKRILNKIYEQISHMAYEEENYIRTKELNQYVFEYLLELENKSEYILEINEELDLNYLLKSAGVKSESREDNFLERLLRYIDLLHVLLKKEIIVLVNIRSYLTDLQMEEFVKMLQYKEIAVLFIENQQKSCVRGTKQYIIDKDQCEIF